MLYGENIMNNAMEYEGLLADEDHQRLEGWSERAESLVLIIRQIADKLALGTSSL